MSDVPATVAFLGPPGTFSHAAVQQYFGHAVRLLDRVDIEDVFLAVEAGEATHGVVPVENSTEGAVTISQDCLIDTSLSIVAEVYVPIEHNLLVRNPDASPERIVSHKQSLAQCRRWLKTHFPRVPRQEAASNAEAARQAAENESVAAVAGRQAAQVYDLHIKHARIQDRSNNTTRFVVLADETTAPTGRDKTSILIHAENRPGSLFRILEPFNDHQVSLTKIETRPARDGIWDYVFFIDFEGHIQDEAVRQVFARLAETSVEIKRLGSYPMADSQ